MTDNKTNTVLIEAFSQQLRLHRHGRKLSQEDIAERAGVSVRFISLLETGKRQPTLSTLAALADALDIPLGEFMTEIDTQAHKGRG